MVAASTSATSAIVATPAASAVSSGTSSHTRSSRRDFKMVHIAGGSGAQLLAPPSRAGSQATHEQPEHTCSRLLKPVRGSARFRSPDSSGRHGASNEVKVMSSLSCFLRGFVRRVTNRLTGGRRWASRTLVVGPAEPVDGDSVSCTKALLNHLRKMGKEAYTLPTLAMYAQIEWILNAADLHPACLPLTS